MDDPSIEVDRLSSRCRCRCCHCLGGGGGGWEGCILMEMPPRGPCGSDGNEGVDV